MVASKTTPLAANKLVLLSVALGNELIMFNYKQQIYWFPKELVLSRIKQL